MFLRLNAGGQPRDVDAFLAILTGGGLLFFVDSQSRFTPLIAKHLLWKNVASNETLLVFDDIPMSLAPGTGTYRWFAALVDSATGEAVGGVSSFPFNMTSAAE